jgi:hypothetical protein
MRTLKEPTNESGTDVALGEGAALSGPSETVLENPGVEHSLCLKSQPQVWISPADLQYSSRSSMK